MLSPSLLPANDQQGVQTRRGALNKLWPQVPGCLPCWLAGCTFPLRVHRYSATTSLHSRTNSYQNQQLPITDRKPTAARHQLTNQQPIPNHQSTSAQQLTRSPPNHAPTSHQSPTTTNKSARSSSRYYNTSDAAFFCVTCKSPSICAIARSLHTGQRNSPPNPSTSSW